MKSAICSYTVSSTFASMFEFSQSFFTSDGSDRILLTLIPSTNSDTINGPNPRGLSSVKPHPSRRGTGIVVFSWMNRIVATSFRVFSSRHTAWPFPGNRITTSSALPPLSRNVTRRQRLNDPLMQSMTFGSPWLPGRYYATKCAISSFAFETSFLPLVPCVVALRFGDFVVSREARSV